MPGPPDLRPHPKVNYPGQGPSLPGPNTGVDPLDAPFQPVWQKDKPNGYAGLDETGSIPASELGNAPSGTPSPGSITTAMLAAGAATGVALGGDVAKLSAGKLSPVSQTQQILASADLTDGPFINGTGAAQIKTGTLTAPVIDNGGLLFRVEAKGAVGDGATDCTTAIASAITAAHAAGGGTVEFGAGDFLCAGLTCPYSDVSIRGLGKGVSRILLPVGANTIPILFSSGGTGNANPSAVLTNVSVQDLEVNANMVQATTGTAASATATTLTVAGTPWTANQYQNYAVYITAGTGSGQSRTITSNTTNQLTVAAWSTNPDATSQFQIWTQLNASGIVPGNFGTSAVLMLGVQRALVRDLYVHDSVGHGIDVERSSGVWVEDNWLDNCGAQPIPGTRNSINVYGNLVGQTDNTQARWHTIRHNTIRHIMDVGIDAAGNGADGFIIEGNHVDGLNTANPTFGTGSYGIALENETGDTLGYASHRSRIALNIVRSVSTGIFINTFVGATTTYAATGGSTTTAQVSGSSWTVNYLAGATITFTSGANNGLTRTITGNTATTLTWTGATTAVAAADTFTISAYLNVPYATDVSTNTVSDSLVTGISVQGANHCGVTNNRIYRFALSSTGNGIEFNTNSGHNWPFVDAAIKGNLIYTDTTIVGAICGVFVSVRGGDTLDGLAVDWNECYGPGVGNTNGSSAGIFLDASSGQTTIKHPKARNNTCAGWQNGILAHIDNEQLLGNNCYSNNDSGIIVGAISSVNVVTPMVADNVCVGNGVTGTGTYNSGIAFFSTSGTYSNNTVTTDANQSVGYRPAGMSAVTSNNTIIGGGATGPGNPIYNGSFPYGTKGIVRISGLLGFNPAGSVVAPAVPATTVALTNDRGVDCMVLVTGGTVSAIAIGGVATGITLATGVSQWFRVPAGQTITLTYTVAPTWTWWGD